MRRKEGEEKEGRMGEGRKTKRIEDKWWPEDVEKNAFTKEAGELS